MATTPAGTADAIIRLLCERGTSDYIGESISQLEHCLQCAHSAAEAGSDDQTVIAALLHDIGQFLPMEDAKDVRMSMGEYSVGRVGHERVGEEYLKGLGFGDKVSRLVGSHVAAKRYLTAVDLSYYDALSEASKQSLKFQGGPFEGKDLEAFEQDPLRDEMEPAGRVTKIMALGDKDPSS
ncbi:hypothetical protein V501_09739 [Pseudogymnoascus sp. VKM F-4519 (FW-2642)]|nr:hypothetical protein V501_09739 [Pseudogymnoascus sp. VKM F-4519 (FW-2642)]